MKLQTVGSFEEEWRRRFQHFAREFESEHLISGWSENGLRRRLARFAEFIGEQDLPAPARVLDLGCGAGSYVRYLATFGHKVVGVDYSLPSLWRALAADSKRIGSYAGAEAYHLPFRDHSFDVVLSSGVFQTLRFPESALDEMARVVRREGLIVVEFLNAFEPFALAHSIRQRLAKEPPRLRTYSPFDIRKWLEQRGFEVIRRVGIYLTPRRYPRLAGIFDRKPIVNFIEQVPGLSLAIAHAFFVVGKKRVAIT